MTSTSTGWRFAWPAWTRTRRARWRASSLSASHRACSSRPGLAGVESLRVAVQAAAAEQGNPDLLAQRIVDEIGRVLARDRVSAGPDGEVAR